MRTSVRLGPELEDMVANTAHRLSVSRSEVIRRSIRDYCSKGLGQAEVYPWDLMKDLVGGFHSGRGDLARNSHEYAKEIIRARHRK